MVKKVRTSSSRVTQHISRTNDRSLQSSPTSFPNKVFASPLALAVTSSKSGGATLEVILLADTSLASRQGLLGLLHVMLRVEDTGRTDKRELLGLAAGAKFQCVNGSQDVRRLERRVGIHPVDESSIVNHGVHAVGEIIPHRLGEAE